MHWFSRPAFRRMDSSGKRMVMGAETSLLLNHLIESASTVNVTFQVRDLCAYSIAEFLKWTIKQSSEQCLWEDSAIPEFLLRKIGILANHPSPFKRLAASVIFNKIQRFFRQSEPLLSIFTLELFADFITGLSLAESDPATLGTITGCVKSLDYLQLIVTQNKEIFTHSDPRRRIDPYFIEGTLAELVSFLFRHIFRTQRHCRGFCMDAFQRLAPLPFVDSARQYLQKQGESIPDDFCAQLDIYRWLLDRDVVSLTYPEQNSKFINSHFRFIDECWKQLQDDCDPCAIPPTFLLWLEFLQIYFRKSENAGETLLCGGTQLIQVLLHAVLLPQRFGFLHFHFQLRQDLYNGLKDVFDVIISRPSLKSKCQEVIKSVISLDQFHVDSTNWNEDCKVNQLLHIHVPDLIRMIFEGWYHTGLGAIGNSWIFWSWLSVPADL